MHTFILYTREWHVHVKVTNSRTRDFEWPPPTHPKAPSITASNDSFYFGPHGIERGQYCLTIFSVPGDFWALSVKILVFPSATGYMFRFFFIRLGSIP
jgi:hypothetical protein